MTSYDVRAGGEPAAARPDPPRPAPARAQVQPRGAVHPRPRRARPPAARGRAGLQLLARADGPRPRGDAVPRVRPPDAPRARRAARVGRASPAWRPSGTSSRRRRRCSRSGRGTPPCCGPSPPTPTASRSPRTWSTRMRAAEEFGKGFLTRTQMAYAAISYWFHQERPADLTAPLQELMERYSLVGWCRTPTSTPASATSRSYTLGVLHLHLVLVIAKDLFTAFDPDDLFAPEVAHRYRDTVLAAGGSRDAADLVADFLGRPYDDRAFRAWLEQRARGRPATERLGSCRTSRCPGTPTTGTACSAPTSGWLDEQWADPRDAGAGDRRRPAAPGRRSDHLGLAAARHPTVCGCCSASATASSTSPWSSTRRTPRASRDDWVVLRALVQSLADETSPTGRSCCTRSGWPSGCWATRHCPRCGGRLEPRQAGHVLHCTDCGRDQFPRSDPAVIMVVTDGEPGSPRRAGAARPQPGLARGPLLDAGRLRRAGGDDGGRRTPRGRGGDRRQGRRGDLLRQPAVAAAGQPDGRLHRPGRWPPRSTSTARRSRTPAGSPARRCAPRPRPAPWSSRAASRSRAP